MDSSDKDDVEYFFVNFNKLDEMFADIKPKKRLNPPIITISRQGTITMEYQGENLEECDATNAQ